MGADAATTLTTDKDIVIGNVKVPAGVHTLYLQAHESGPWQLVVNKQTKQWGTIYNQDQDLGRAAMKLSKTDGMVEKLKISVLSITTDHATGGEIDVEWGNTKATVPIKVQ